MEIAIFCGNLEMSFLLNFLFNEKFHGNCNFAAKGCLA